MNSFTPCKGNAKIEIAIGQNSDGPQKSEQAFAQTAAKAKQDKDSALAEINSKGNEFAKEAGNIWKFFEKKDPLSCKTILFARA